MKTLRAALVLLPALVAGAAAQVPLDPEQKEQLEALKKQLEAEKKKQAGKKAAPAAPKVMADQKVIRDVADRLTKDGEEGAIAGMPGLVARTYHVNGEPDQKGFFANHVITLIERPMASPTSEDGSITYLVMRKELIQLQATRQTYTPLKDGKAKVEVWSWRVELDGEITACTKTTMIGKVIAPRTIDLDPAHGGSSREEKVAPSDAAAKASWGKIEKALPFMGRFLEV